LWPVSLENANARSRKEKQDKIAAKEPTFRTKRRSPTLPTPPMSPTAVKHVENVGNLQTSHGSLKLGSRATREESRGLGARSLPFDTSPSSLHAGVNGAPPRRTVQQLSSSGSDSPLDASSDINSPASTVAGDAAGRPMTNAFNPTSAPGSFIDYLRSQTNTQASSRYSSSNQPNARILRITRENSAHREETRPGSFRRMFHPNL
jgi:hypothetical protein